MRAGVKAANALNLVAKEVESVRLIGIVGIDIDQAAACGDLARMFAERFGVVVELASECVDQLFEGMRFASA